jgi:hypothetical protein
MPRRALDPCPSCGVTVVWVKINTRGDLRSFERADSPAMADMTGHPEYLRWALTPGLHGHFATVRDLDAAPVPLLHGEHNALPHDVVCTKRLVPTHRRRTLAAR